VNPEYSGFKVKLEYSFKVKLEYSFKETWTEFQSETWIQKFQIFPNYTALHHIQTSRFKTLKKKVKNYWTI